MKGFSVVGSSQGAIGKGFDGEDFVIGGKGGKKVLWKSAPKNVLALRDKIKDQDAVMSYDFLSKNLAHFRLERGGNIEQYLSKVSNQLDEGDMIVVSFSLVSDHSVRMKTFFEKNPKIRFFIHFK